MATILELAQLSAAAYGGPVPNGWTKIGQSQTSHGYFGVAFHNAAGDIVIANRGTDIWNFSNFTNLLNLGSDIQLALGHATLVQDDAATFALSIAKNPLYSGKPIIETGHSLGGNEAQAAVVALVKSSGLPPSSITGVTFNSPGIGGYAHGSTTNYNVTNFFDQGDAIHLAGGSHLGTSILRRGSKLRYTFLNSRIHSRGDSARLCNGKTAIFEPRPLFVPHSVTQL